MITFPIGNLSFNPLQTPGIIRWYDGNDPLANGVVPADGTAISTWVDKCGSGSNLTQGTGGNQAILKRNVINGLSSMLFNGSTNFYTSSILSNTLHTVFISYKALALAGAAPNYLIYNGNTGGNGWGYLGNSTSRTILFGSVAVKSDGTMPTATEKSTFSWDGTTSILRVNGTQQVITSPTSAPNSPAGNLIVGKDTSASGFWNGYIDEIIICNASVAATFITQNENFLKRWGV